MGWLKRAERLAMESCDPAPPHLIASPLWSIPAQAGVPLVCTPAGVHLALDELIQFIKLVLVLLRW